MLISFRFLLGCAREKRANSTPVVEIHNRKRNQGHIPYYKDCYYYLTRMSQPDSECFGNKHQDTKGGTWQVGSHAISYHALAHSVEDMNKDLNKHG